MFQTYTINYLNRWQSTWAVRGFAAAIFWLALFLLGASTINAQTSCNAEGGTLSFADGSTTIITCADDGISDAFTPSLTDVVGSSGAWLITNNYGLILGTPAGPTFDFEGAGDGVCFLYHIAFNEGFSGEIATGDNICNLTGADGCYDLSNYIAVIRRTGDDCAMACDAEGGELSIAGTDGETSLTICAGDDQSDAFDVVLADQVGENSGWIIADLEGTILALPTSPPFDLDGAGPGICLVYHISSTGEVDGLQEGGNTMELDGCFSLSNFIQVIRNQPEGGTLAGGPFEFCAGDELADMIPEDGITLSGNSGEFSQWVITDDQGNILGLPPTFSVVDFDGAGPGTCLVWHLSYDGPIAGLEVDANAADLEGCFSLSNPIEVVRNQPEGGTLAGGPFEFCAGDELADMIGEDEITLSGNSGEFSQWVITDDQGNILGLPPTFSVVDFDGAGPGTCLVWHLSYDGPIAGLEVDANAADLEGCFSLSNPIEVERNQPEGGTLAGGPFEFCAGDELADMIPEDGITLSGNSGEFSQWVITDDQGNILGLPPTFSVVDFDGAGPGTCLVWHLSYDGPIAGLEVDANAADLEGCFSLSNPIEVVRNQPEGGTLAGGPFEFCAGDELADMIPEDGITLSGNSGEFSQWVITDDQGNILGLPPTFSVVDFDGAGPGTCLVWHLSYDGPIAGLEVDANAADLEGCFSLSNPIEVVRNQPEGGTLAGGPFEFCAGDELADMIPEDGITLSGNSGEFSQWVITDDQGNILGLPPTFSVVDFDGAGAGTCLVWHLSYDGPIAGLEVDANAADLEGCFSLSNPIEVERNQPEGGTLAGGPFEFCAGDELADMIPEDGITLSGNSGEFSQWVITDDQGNILGLPPTFSVVDFDGAGPGTCLVWHLSYDGPIAGLEVDANAADLEGCFSLSNPIEVERNQPEGGTLAGGPFEFCAGDELADMIPEDGITLSGNSGEFSQWVITDDQGNILGLPPTFSVVDFDGAGAGTCLVWHLSYDGPIAGLEVDANAADLEGCFSLSNPIEVERNQPEGGTLAGGPFEFCAGDDLADMIGEDEITLSDNSGEFSQWVITDDQGNILGLPPTFSVVDFDGAGAGTCLVWHLSYDGPIAGLEVDANAADLEGCFSLSNPIEVERNQPEGGTLAGGPFEFCAGDELADMIPEDGITLSGNSGEFSQWVITDDQGNILGLPPTFSVVDFDGAGAGTCLVWHLSYDGPIAGLEVDANAADLEGCFSLSNPIEVVRNQPEGGTLAGGPFSFTVGDDVADMIGEDEITLSDNSGEFSQWVITDDQGNILGLPPTFSVVDFDGAGPGTCLVWHLSYDGEISGLEAAANAADLMGCFSLSNPIEVNRMVEGAVNGGTLEGGPFEFCAGDELADLIGEDEISLTGAVGDSSQWVITDDQGIILGLPPTFSVVDFDGAGPGTCLVWHLSYNGTIFGLEADANANDLMGDFSLSNPIEVVRNQPAGGTLEGGPFSFCAGDDLADMIGEDEITLSGNSGEFSQWVITDDQGNILGLPPTFSVVDFDGAGPGTCLVWHLSYDGDIQGLVVDANAEDLLGCFSLSNPIEVVRQTGDDCGSGFTFPTVVISEVAANGNIELYNDTEEAVDVSDYWLCNFPTYTRVSDLQLECGNLLIQPGEVVVVSGFSAFNDTDAELGLYTINVFSSPDAIISYLEWGSSGHTRAAVAIEAGLWTEDFFLAMPTAGNSLQQIIDNDAPAWVTDIASFCEPNFFRSTSTNEFAAEGGNLIAFPNPANQLLSVETTEFTNGNSTLRLINLNGQVVLERKLDYSNGLTQLNISQLPAGTYLLQLSNARSIATRRVMVAN